MSTTTELRTTNSTTKPAPRGGTARRLKALSRAEWLQFRRNKTLLFMSTVIPIALPIGMYALMRSDDADGTTLATMAIEFFLFYVLMFAQFYTVLSMATTRRDEGVLRRLRTGESRDGEILTSLGVPGAALIIPFLVIVVLGMWALGAPLPENPLPVLVATILGLVIAWALALLTSGFTKNAEAAQITSMPVFLLATVSLGNIRLIFPEAVQDILDRTPFALAYDLAAQSWDGSAVTDALVPAGLLLAWTVGLSALALRRMKWSNRV